MGRQAALATRFARFLPRPFVSRSLLMRGFAAFTRDLALLRRIHRPKSAFRCGHLALPGSATEAMSFKARLILSTMTPIFALLFALLSPADLDGAEVDTSEPWKIGPLISN